MSNNQLMVIDEELSSGRNLAQFESMLGKRGAASFISGILTSVKDNPKLLECPPDNIVSEALKGAAYNLPIGSSFGMSWLVPRYSKKHRGQRALWQPGYKGLKQMAMRSNEHDIINVDKLYEGQVIEQDQLTGKVRIAGQRTSNKPIGYFGYLHKLNGYEGFVYWSLADLEAHRKKYADTNPTWKTHPDEMRRKTVLINLLKEHATLDFDLKEFADDFLADKVEDVEPTGQLEEEIEVIDGELVPEEGIKYVTADDVNVVPDDGAGQPDPAWDTIKAGILELVDENANRTLTEKQAKLFPIVWRELFDNQEDRYAVTDYLFEGITSSKDITDPQALGLLKWMKLEAAKEGKKTIYVPSDACVKEKATLVSNAYKAQGQLEFGV